MNQQNITIYIALWGAALSTILFIIKIWEAWKNRARIEISHNFTSHQEIGNEVIIRNISNTPIIITYWELLRIKGSILNKKENLISSPEDFDSDLKINNHSSITLTFNHQDYFDWGISSMKQGRIYIRLYFAGKSKPILYKVYG